MAARFWDSGARRKWVWIGLAAFALDDYRLNNAAIEFEDQAVPFRTLLEPLSLRIEHFTTKPDSEAGLFLVPPKPADASPQGQARATLSLN